jgi:hypothetical protein
VLDPRPVVLRKGVPVAVEVGNTEPCAICLGRVRWSDPALGGADRGTTLLGLAQSVHGLQEKSARRDGVVGGGGEQSQS